MTVLVPPQALAPVPETAPGPLDGLIADCAEAARHLAEVPRQQVVTIPQRAVALVADLGTYGD